MSLWEDGMEKSYKGMDKVLESKTQFKGASKPDDDADVYSEAIMADLARMTEEWAEKCFLAGFEQGWNARGEEE